MATSQGLPVDSVYQTGHLSMADSNSLAGSGFFHDDMTFDMSRTDTSGTGMSSMFADTNDWVTAQSTIGQTPPNLILSNDASFVHPQDGLNFDSWASITNSRQASVSMDNAWTMASNTAPIMAPSVSEIPQWAGSISSTSSPITTASMCEIEGSCSPELVMAPLAMSPAVYDSMSGPAPFSGETNEQWNAAQGYVHLEAGKEPYTSVDTKIPQVLRPSLEQTGRRQSNESDPQKARSDSRYRVQAGPDGLYHCPMDGCQHIPDKLKCNYDKHLDSHLKPYRCKVKTCQDVAFSSTACVLRHEREAHGMHGHGNKPFVCMFHDCERSNPENGFPRRWNLHDHMRRMHNYTTKSVASEEDTESRGPGPVRTKKGSRTSPKPRLTKDDTAKAASRKGSKSLTTKSFPERQTFYQTPNGYQISYSNEPVEGSPVSATGIYASWNQLV